ncbi:PST family polysaccharide transporter [Aneurinibacillus soli]|uniref:Putative cell division protein YtgP n=1 Tax=Aneurinibacillus soli TaxID=1500254 RepID=A0A0U5B5Q7_9BACL|nr:polysaccharide biosynthesis protein [Aneurinibacillus soli]PYE58332.1 PST family polysaccharide transporter [Aneurinibacillus soli]BAU26189.1 putative cell division protein YtgP [Aneurinibacillus soli]
MSRDQGASFLKGAAILGAGALLSKMLGVVYRIPYQNITGDLGYYVYTQVYPLYSALLILATAGFPIAISKFVAEKLAVGDVYGARRVFRVSAVVLSITGLLFFVLLWASAPWIASLMRDVRLTQPIRSVSFALLIVPIMAAMRGYFQGHHNMVPTAVSQIGEQFVRVTTIIILSYWFMKTTGDVYLAGSGAVFGAVTGASFAFCIMLLFWRRNGASQRQYGQVHDRAMTGQSDTVRDIVRKLFYYAIPICLGSLVLPLMQLADSFSVVSMLMRGGYGSDEAYVLKGVFDRGQPLVQFAAFLATALSLSIVPAIAEAQARRQSHLIAERTELALRLTFLFGLPASIGLAIVAGPVNVMLYENGNGTTALTILAFTTIFSTLGITSAGILQGVGQVVLPVRNLLIGVLVKLGLNIVLIPMFGIVGASLSTTCSYMIATILNVYAVASLTGARFGFVSFFLKPFTAVGMMALAAFVARQAAEHSLAGLISSPRLYFTAVSLAAVGAGVMMYAAALLLSGTVTRSDLESTKAGRRLVPLLKRLRLLHE